MSNGHARMHNFHNIKNLDPQVFPSIRTPNVPRYAPKPPQNMVRIQAKIVKEYYSFFSDFSSDLDHRAWTRPTASVHAEHVSLI